MISCKIFKTLELDPDLLSKVFILLGLTVKYRKQKRTVPGMPRPFFVFFYFYYTGLEVVNRSFIFFAK
jgi:hypothetical protein